ncbi:phage major capsid protein [Clostridium perfringens]|uniref:phage major capsid protein n=1 Tax=Clostridium perfringens TaxID=1502 RepID=UPI001E548528|nr:phage major capsid protein [Clostridium perfringens]WVL78362.1 phage major capsid protein [Clostridium perfringens]
MANTIKALKEQYNSILDKIDAIYDRGIVETRSLDESENSEIETLQKEAEEIKAQIEEEERSLEESDKEENTSMENTVDLEIRGMEDYIRGNDSEELRAMTLADNSKGIVPSVLDKNIIKKIEEVAPIFNEVTKFTPVAGTLTIPIEDNIGSASFVGEGTGTSETKFSFKTVDLTQRRAGSEVTLSQFLINDSGIDIVNYAQEILFRRLGYALDRAMITGTVSGKSFEGLATVNTKCEYKGLKTIDTFIGAMASMKTVYQSGAKWIMNRKSFELIVKMKDATGNLYVAREVIGTGIQYKLFGLEILINDAVANDYVYLVNIKEAYRGMIKKGTSLSKISEDTQNRRAGTVTLVLDTYVDARIVQEEAIKAIHLVDSME